MKRMQMTPTSNNGKLVVKMICPYNEWSCQTVFNDMDRICHIMLSGKSKCIEHDSVLVKYSHYRCNYENTYLGKSIDLCKKV